MDKEHEQYPKRKIALKDNPDTNNVTMIVPNEGLCKSNIYGTNYC